MDVKNESLRIEENINDVKEKEFLKLSDDRTLDNEKELRCR